MVLKKIKKIRNYVKLKGRLENIQPCNFMIEKMFNTLYFKTLIPQISFFIIHKGG